MMNIVDIFNGCSDQDESFSEEYLELLNNMMNISSPMKFTDDFVSEEQIDELIEKMMEIDEMLPVIHNVCQKISDINPVKGKSRIFI